MPDKKMLEDVERRFPDYFFEATRGRNDVRREKITSAIHQAVAEVLTTMIERVEKQKWNYYMAKNMNRQYVLALDDVLTILREELTKKD